ncbi:putative signal peptide and transmembrane domain containing protein [Cryptosporidium canis]|uniref:Signal peptide and transmembrane domain containing protein n=1 Tax=Cryptosporidium canis TaxID=195482 RepID=A0ABQ8P6L2_9CRYT|nr:putative signal peptide and transmembrane domain containing protein [Cryptosporidium canis]KAJ1609376.1 putative signal peptide and transmembrane domain containing protein [Cryptosporidium canis]
MFQHVGAFTSVKIVFCKQNTELMKIRGAIIILTLSCLNCLYTYCFNETIKPAIEPVLNRFPRNDRAENFKRQTIYPLVSLEIKTQQLKLEGEIILPKIVSRRILVAKGVVESRILSGDVLFFSTDIKDNQRVSVKQLVGIVAYDKANREELLYSSCDGVMNEVKPLGFYEFETIFFIIYCDLKKSVMSSYFGYSMLPYSERDAIFDKVNGTLIKRTDIREGRYSSFSAPLEQSEGRRKLAIKRKASPNQSKMSEYHDELSESHNDRPPLNAICGSSKSSLTSDTPENPGTAIKRVEFLCKRRVPDRKKIVDSSLTMKLSAYRKSLEDLKLSVANITDFSRMGSAKIEDEKRIDSDEQKTIAADSTGISTEYGILTLLAFVVIILILLSIRNT